MPDFATIAARLDTLERHLESLHAAVRAQTELIVLLYPANGEAPPDDLDDLEPEVPLPDDEPDEEDVPLPLEFPGAEP